MFTVPMDKTTTATMVTTEKKRNMKLQTKKETYLRTALYYKQIAN